MTKGNMNTITIVPKIGAAYVEPVNLKPTNYCTAMWNGIRCDGTHEVTWVQDQGFEVFHSARGESGRYHSMWRDGYGGICLDDRVYIEELDFDLGWSDLDRIHAEARERRDYSWARITNPAHASAYAGQLAAIAVDGLLEMF